MISKETILEKARAVLVLNYENIARYEFYKALAKDDPEEEERWEKARVEETMRVQPLLLLLDNLRVGNLGELIIKAEEDAQDWITKEYLP